ncbi:MAG: phenylalanyl-tRNA synthetase beta chain [Planctomycetota bacterium]|jgi:phenylalanyl-tRNA synthetase beta chain
MLISYKWLARHIDLTGLDVDEVARLLTLHTAEVEGVERVVPHMDAVVVGYVAERVKHPDADKLNICTVDVGADEPLQIVCGAPNVDKGQKVAVAQVGTLLPGDFKIKKSKIRGVESRGMICSVRELELGDEHDGIWVIDAEAKVGQSVASELDMVDWAIEIDNKAITHRPDLWGHRGFARELSAITGRELLPLDLTLPETGASAGVPVRVETSNCSRYVALEISGLTAELTPAWMRQLLLAVGQRPIELSVDVSNFVMFDLGQPNHLFDRTQISNDGIVVRDASAGEKMTTLDDVERELCPEDILITSGDKPVAIAGVMGGKESMVAAGTSVLLLEVASFHPTVIRRTSTRIGLRTDASARFEKSLDPMLPMQAAAHLVRTLAEIVPGIELPSTVTDAGDWQDPSSVIELRPERLRNLLGTNIPDDELRGYLERLGFGVEGTSPLKVSVPSFRATKDITLEVDLIEEVGRLYGLTKIEEQELVTAVRPLPLDERREAIRTIQDRLAGGARFHEVLTYSFLPEDLAQKTGVADEDYVQVVNAVSEGWNRVRRSVVPSVIGLLEKNLRNREDVRLFEVGKGYLPADEEHPGDRGQPRQVHEVALAWAAPKPGKRSRFDGDRLSALKAVVEDLGHALRVPITWHAVEDDRPAWSHPARRVVGGYQLKKDFFELCFLADLDPRVARSLGVSGDVAVASFSIDAYLAIAERASTYETLPKFPGNKIDVALAIPEAVTAEQVRSAIEHSGKGLVRDVELFDLYRGEQVGDGRKSLAYHVLLQSPTKTVTDKEAQKFLGRLEREIEKLSGELRKE